MLNNNRPTVGIVDYSLGNLFSIERAIKHIGATPIITDDPDIIISCDRLILPGVGAFGDGINALREKNLIATIKFAINSGTPLLGICLGMQLLMSMSEEFGVHPGLDLIKGKVRRFQEAKSDESSLKIPHVGWNSLRYPDRSNWEGLEKMQRRNSWRGTILEDLEEGAFVYFAHSYIVVPDNVIHIIATTQYGNDAFCSVISIGNIMGCQFHPERSGEVGLSVYRKFIFSHF